MTQLQALPNRTADKLRVDFIHQPTKQKLFKFRKHPFPIQNEPFEFGFKITNIGKSAFQGCVIENLKIYHKNADVEYSSDEKPHIRALNPNESVEIYFDKYTSVNEGPIWIECDLKSTIENIDIQPYQYDVNHNSDGVCSKINHWGNSSFIQGKLELLQANTNIQILILTTITVLEAVFGLKNILQGFFGVLSSAFIILGELFGYLA